MTGFFIKKAFFDGWDNLLTLIALNVGFILLIILFLAIPMIASGKVALTIFMLVLVIYLFHFYSGGVSLFLGDLVFDRAPEFREFPSYITSTWKLSAVFGTITTIHVLILMIGFPFYISLGGVFGLAALAILFWVSVLWWFISLWIFPVRRQLNTEVKKVLKKSLILFFDNPGFSVFMGIYSLINFLISVATAFLVPGISSILYSHQIALKLLMYKYDYIEEHPNVNPKEIPWGALLMNEKEKVGPRSLKGMIFPWKD
ncbi:MAG: hypothetical protein K9L66_05160 [Spirochaetaceae bacterium]|nr:hypothetical protein [Spirochaetaceae bacterium]MCF7949054.1 hypothetical protein [Spirochaetia bacterium]MCF7951042.1 hypothetical protein [Spirochaetaceae bacterium]